MITRLTIQHYRSIETHDLKLGPVNVLVGRNGAGKSNIIDAVKFVRDALRHGLDHAVTQRHGIANIRQWSPYRPFNVTIGIEAEHDLDDGSAKDSISFSFTLASTRDGYAINREECKYSAHPVVKRDADGKISRPVFSGSYIRSQDGTVTIDDGGKKELIKLDDVSEFFIRGRQVMMTFIPRRLLTNFESYAIFPNTLRQAEKQSTETFLAPHGDNLASVLKRLTKERRSDALAEIVSAMQSVIPDLDSIQIQSVGGYIVPRFRIKSPGADKAHFFDVDQLSDGSLRILGLLAALYQDPIPATIALEEPEQTVHPGALQLIADSIAEVSQTTQVLVTTHSPDFLDRFDPDQIIAVEYSDEKTTARSLAASQIDAVRNNLFSLGQLMSIEGLHG